MTFAHFVKDLFIYNSTFLLVFFSMNYTNFEGSQNVFKNRLLFLAQDSPFKTLPVTEFIQANFVLIYQSVLAGLFLLSILAILSEKKLLKFVHTILLGLFCFILYNPFLPENKIEAPYGIRKELILSVGLFIVRMMNILDFKNNKTSNK
jgi:prolipoprotein diacylglyceryltransferase